MIRSLTMLVVLACGAVAQEGAQVRWKGLDFLLGNWTGSGGGEPGSGAGKFSFEQELRGQVVVRRSFNQLAKGARHEDLLVIYADGPGGALRAMYFDSEGHVIRYQVSTPGAERAVFESEGEGARYRLSYWMAGKVLKGKFEVENRTYLEWDASRDAKHIEKELPR